MAKKIVRGITDVKTINDQDFDTNNVNDLLSDGQYNYIHRKKGKNEEYHNLTDNLKTISSDNTELLSVTNNNKTTNSATLSPKHDAQKEQVLESTRDTITINHGTNGTDEKTTVDTNPQKVLEHDNLLTNYGISKVTEGNTTTLGLEYTIVEDGFDLNTIKNGHVRSNNFLNSPQENTWLFVSSYSEGNVTVQEAVKMFGNNTRYVRSGANNVFGEWREQVGDKYVIDALLAKKQNKLTAGDGITIQGNTISASAPVEGATVSVQGLSSPGEFNAKKHVITIGQQKLTTFTFECFTQTAEHVISGKLKEELAKFISPGYSATNSALKLTNDGTDMKLINTTPEYHNIQHATFTFHDDTAGGATPE